MQGDWAVQALHDFTAGDGEICDCGGTASAQQPGGHGQVSHEGTHSLEAPDLTLTPKLLDQFLFPITLLSHHIPFFSITLPASSKYGGGSSDPTMWTRNGSGGLWRPPG